MSGRKEWGRSLPDSLRKAKRASEKAGWTWVLKGSNHVTVRDAEGDFVDCIGLSMYEGAIVKKHLSKLKKRGCPGIR